jgi:glycosyltransferase involved in cell wall biosynthesis
LNARNTLLHTNFLRRWSGETNRILVICRGLTALGWDVHLATPADSELAERANGSEITLHTDFVFRRGLRPKDAWRDYTLLKSIVSQHNIALVHTHGAQDTWTAALANGLRNKRFKLLRTRHNSFPVASHMFNRWLYQTAIDQLILVSGSLRREFAGVIACDKLADLPVVHSSIDTRRFAEFGNEAQEVREELGLPMDTPLLGVIGRFSRNKGQLFLLEAMPEILAAHPRVHLLLVGEGGGRGAIENKICQLGLQKQVHLLGFRTDIPRLQRSLTIAILPSTSCDASSATLKEALAAERPVVVTDVGGAREITQEGKTALVVQPSVHAALGNAVIRLLDDPEKSAQMGQLGRRYVIEKFSQERLVENTLEVYQRVLGEKA